MAFPASTQTQVDALTGIRRVAINLKAQSQSLLAILQSDGATASQLVGYFGNLKSSLDNFITYASVPGLAQYAQNQYDDDTLNIVTEYQAMKEAVENTIEWIATNIPTDSNGYAAIKLLNVDGTIQDRSFGVAAVAPLASLVSTLIGTID